MEFLAECNCCGGTICSKSSFWRGGTFGGSKSFCMKQYTTEHKKIYIKNYNKFLYRKLFQRYNNIKAEEQNLNFIY